MVTTSHWMRRDIKKWRTSANRLHLTIRILLPLPSNHVIPPRIPTTYRMPNWSSSSTQVSHLRFLKVRSTHH
jgi:hypothetical protein